MPTYEYRCRDCGHELEAQQSFSDPALTECPSCAGTLRKKFSAVGISFKGSGFYKTDSRSSSRSGNGRTSSTDGTSSDSTPATPSSESSPTSSSSGSDGGTKTAATAST